MNAYLVRVTIYEGEHEHTHFALIAARTQQEAWKLAELEIEKQEREKDFDVAEDERGYWSYGDGTTRTQLESVEELQWGPALVISHLGLASFLKRSTGETNYRG